MRREIERRLSGRGAMPQVVLGERLREPEAVRAFYVHRAHEPAWLGPDAGPAVARAAHELHGQVEQSSRHGLHPRAYHADALARVRYADLLPADRLAGLELLLTDAFLHLARHLSRGAIDPASLHPRYRRAGDPPPDPTDVLAAALARDRVARTLRELAPPHAEYAGLVRALARLRAAADAGDADAAVRAERIRANLERWRWLPRALGERHLRVNVPSFTLHAFERDRPVLELRVVVGSVGWKTPLAHGAIDRIVLNPAWNVPRSIATRELLPAAQRDPAYFAKAGLQVLADAEGETREVDPAQVAWSEIGPETFPYRLRQPPGPANPLGEIKFVFENPFGVYLHGTPSDAAFQRPLRALSHGCVRVEDEHALAAFALAPDPQWTRERLTVALRTARERPVPLPVALPVYLLYFTASADPSGSAAFASDPYDWDPPLLAALDARAAPRPAPIAALGSGASVGSAAWAAAGYTAAPCAPMPSPPAGSAR